MTLRSVSIPVEELSDIGFNPEEIEKFPLETTNPKILEPFENMEIVQNDSEKIGNVNKLYIPKKDSLYAWIYYPINDIEETTE